MSTFKIQTTAPGLWGGGAATDEAPATASTCEGRCEECRAARSFDFLSDGDQTND